MVSGMTPLQPGDDRAADRENGSARKTYQDAEGRILSETGVHLEIVSHMLHCDPCRKQIWQLAMQAIEDALRARDPATVDWITSVTNP